MWTYMMSYAWCLNNWINVKWPVYWFNSAMPSATWSWFLLPADYISSLASTKQYLFFTVVSIFSSQSWGTRVGEEFLRRLLPLLRFLSLSCFRWLLLEDLLRLDVCLVVCFACPSWYNLHSSSMPSLRCLRTSSIFSSQSSWDTRTGEEFWRRLLPLLRFLSLSCSRWLLLEDLLQLDVCLVSFARFSCPSWHNLLAFSVTCRRWLRTGSLFSSQSWGTRVGEELRRRLLPLLRFLSLSCFRWLLLEDLLRLDVFLVSVVCFACPSWYNLLSSSMASLRCLRTSSIFSSQSSWDTRAGEEFWRWLALPLLRFLSLSPFRWLLLEDLLRLDVCLVSFACFSCPCWHNLLSSFSVASRRWFREVDVKWSSTLENSWVKRLCMEIDFDWWNPVFRRCCASPVDSGPKRSPPSESFSKTCTSG